MILTKRKENFSIQSGYEAEKKEKKFCGKESDRITEIHRFTFGPAGNSIISSEKANKSISEFQNNLYVDEYHYTTQISQVIKSN